MKMKSVEKIKVEDEDDIVVMGDVMPKPMVTRIKKRRKRQVEFKKSKSINRSLVITQKVKVKKRRHRCNMKIEKNVSEGRSAHDSMKKKSKYDKDSFEHKKGVKDTSYRCERIAPVCSRQNCRDARCKVERNIRKENETTKVKSNRSFPGDLKRLLSPVSPSSMVNEITKSIDCEISLDTSSFEEEKESKLDTLIKRTRDRDRKFQMERTRYLYTPPQSDELTSKEVTNEKEICTDYKPPYTSTPKYEENIKDNKNTTIANFDTQETKQDYPFFKDIHAVISPIKNSDNLPTVLNKNNVQNINISHENNSTKQTNSSPSSENINSKQKTTASSTIYGDSMSISDSDNFVECSNQGHISFSENAHIQQKYPNTQNFITSTNFEENLENRQISLSQNNDLTKQLSLDHSSFSDVLMQSKKSENTLASFTNRTCDQNVEVNGKSIALENYSFTHPPNQKLSGELVQHDQIEYMHTSFIDKNQNVENTGKLISHNNYILSHHTKQDHVPFSEKLIPHNNTENMPTSSLNEKTNIENQDKAIMHSNLSFSYHPNQDQLFFKEVNSHNEIEYMPTSFPSKKKNIENQEMCMMDYNYCIPYYQNQDHVLFYGEVIPQDKPEFMHTSFPNIKPNIENKEQSSSHNNYSLPQHQNQDYVPFDGEVIPHNKTEFMNTSFSKRNENVENEVSMSHNNRFSQHANQDYIQCSEEHINHNKTEYMHISLFDMNNCNQNNQDKEKSIYHSNYRFSKHKSQDNKSIPNKFIQHKKTEDFFNNPDQSIAKKRKNNPHNNDNNSFSKQRNDSPLFDELGQQSKSEYKQTEFSNKEDETRSTGYNNNFYRHPNRINSPFLEEIIQNEKSEYTRVSFDQTIEVNRWSTSQNRNIRDELNKQFLEDKDRNNRNSAYRRTSVPNVNKELNSEDRFDWTSNFHEYYNDRERSNRYHSPILEDVYEQRKKSEYIHTDISYMDCDRSFEDINMSDSFDNTFTYQQKRNDNEFFEDIQHRRYKSKHSDMTNKSYEQNKNNRNVSASHKNYNYKKQLQMDLSRFNLHKHNEKSGNNQHSARNLYNINKNNITTQTKREHNPLFEDIRIQNKESKFNMDLVEDKKMSIPYKSRNKKNFIQQRRRDRSSYFEEIPFQNKKSDYTRMRTVYSKTKYEHNYNSKMFIANNNKGNKSYSHNRNIPNQYQTSKYVHTVSNKKFNKVIHKRESYV